MFFLKYVYIFTHTSRSQSAPFCFQRKRKKMMTKMMNMRAAHGGDEEGETAPLFVQGLMFSFCL